MILIVLISIAVITFIVYMILSNLPRKVFRTEYGKIIDIAKEEYEWQTEHNGLQPYLTTHEFINHYTKLRSERMKKGKKK